MLVLTRKVDEVITIGDDITVTVLEVLGNKVKLGIKAPGSYRIFRAELVEEEGQQGENAQE